MNETNLKIPVMIRAEQFVRMGMTPIMAAKCAIRSPIDVAACANLTPPKQGEAGSEWYSVTLQGRDAYLVSALVTALAGLTLKLTRDARGWKR